jgi:GGDEF domain-containing protein
MAYSVKPSTRSAGVGVDRFLNREIFLFFLDLEVKRSRRYQNFFCILVLKLKELTEQSGGKGLRVCYQRLSHLLSEEMRDSDILGTLGERSLAVLLPYADISAALNTRSRFENNLQYYDFTREGYQVMVEQVCFPRDGTDTADLIRKVVGPESSNS